MSEADFDSVMIIAGERPEIRTVMSSTPTGKRSKFYQACTDPAMGFIEHFHPSTHNPNWNDEMEAEFRAQLSEQGYVHEVEAEFGVQNTGVFNKDRVDEAKEFYNYAYAPLDYYQEAAIKRGDIEPPDMLIYDRRNPAPYSRFRTIGVDLTLLSRSTIKSCELTGNPLEPYTLTYCGDINKGTVNCSDIVKEVGIGQSAANLLW